MLVLEQTAHLRHAFVEARAALVEAAAAAAELMRQEGAREARLDPTVRDGVEHGDLGRHLERMVEDRQKRAGDETRSCRALRRRRQEHDRVRAVAAIAVEIMLDGADMAVAELVHQIDEAERFVPIDLRRLLLRAGIRKKLEPEMHF